MTSTIRKEILFERKLEKNEVKNAFSEHVSDHINVADEDIKNRFKYCKYPSGHLCNVDTKVYTWFETEKTAVAAATAVLNSPSNRAKIQQWLHLWDASMGTCLTLEATSKTPVGKGVLRQGLWKTEAAFNASKIVVVIECLNATNKEIMVKTVYPVFTVDELRSAQNAVKKCK